MTTVRPVKPREVPAKKRKSIPEGAIEAFNELIVQRFDGYSAFVKQDDVVRLMVLKGLDQAEIFENEWLDVEEIYRKAGWLVRYDAPAYCETYDAFFVFTIRE